ncbi:ABC transporter permease [Tessaracoccus aquimaris]|uniref:ABC transporter permease n=1 Tax=Tessaracoccus aquimaris TaxID=1332264 RepID=UPI000988B31C|nr:ABC transporter permease [Tessaracoccus aquimaris]
MKDYPGVEKAWPIYSIEAVGRVGAYMQYFQINAVPPDVITSLDEPIAWGTAPSEANPGLLVGDQIPLNFYNEATGEVKQVDFSTETLFLDFDTSAMYGPSPQGGGEGDEGEAPKPKKIIMPVAGVLQGDPDQPYGPYTNVVYAEFSAMVEALEKAMPGKALPNQPATSDGKPKPGFVYSMIRLQTPSPEAAEELLTALRTDGFDAQADIEWIREAQKQGALIQAVFGGIGLVSLLVAAIGIANTMMMSVYERTREIGVMKVLGAGLGDIRTLFLFESASIGFLGGLLGLGLSLGGSAIANAIFAGPDSGISTISIIPPWLMIGAVAFATLIGTVAGLAPAIRASRLSPLAAIRTQ